jgi:hypothetical protein
VRRFKWQPKYRFRAFGYLFALGCQQNETAASPLKICLMFNLKFDYEPVDLVALLKKAS